MTVIEMDIVDRRVVGLRDLAGTDLAAARREAWAWIVELGQRVHRDRDEAITELAGLFATGKPSVGLDGTAEGAFVTLTVQPLIDRLVAAVNQAWMPWVGKIFDSAARRGVNMFRPSAWLPMKVLWPAYRLVPTRIGFVAFEYETSVEPSALDGDQNVLHGDYGSVVGNPRFVVSSIHDELVEIVPGVHLGKVLWRTGSSAYLLGYFALRTDR